MKETVEGNVGKIGCEPEMLSLHIISIHDYADGAHFFRVCVTGESSGGGRGVWEHSST